MRDFASRFAARCIDAVRIHRTRLGSQRGVEGYHKVRRHGMEAVYWPGNLFLHWSHSGIRMFASVAAWQQHETRCFQLCHPGRAARPAGRRGIFLEKLPGESLREICRKGRLTPRIVNLAAAELRRSHLLLDPVHGDAWSHGDPHLGNFLFDSSRCYLIDFETEHFPRASANVRHADDVLVFCLELLGHPDSGTAILLSQSFLAAYDDAAIRATVIAKLRLPGGLERVLWATRTAYLPARELQDRLSELRSRIQPST